MSHKVAKEIRKFLRRNEMFLVATHTEYRAIHHSKLSKNGTRYMRYQVVLAENCGRALYKRMKKKHKR